MSSTKTETRFYKPTIQSAEPVIVDKDLTSYPSRLPAVVKVRLKEAAVAHQIAVGLYKNPHAGFRELFSNECRAARTALEHGGNPKIDVTLSPQSRTLTIEGFDSMGITSDVFVDVLRWMGRTTNNEADEVGQFGWGFFAVFTLADSIKLETFARESGECYGVSASDATAFTLLPDDEVSKSTCGTRITMKLKPDIQLLGLLKYIRKCCRYSDIPTYLHVTEKLDLNDSEYSWNRHTIEVEYTRLDGTFREQINAYITKPTDRRVIYSVEVDRPDYYFYGAIAGNDNVCDQYPDRYEIRLLRVPIEATTDLKLARWHSKAPLELPFSCWVLNIKNERAYQPTPDRDRFVDGALDGIFTELDGILKQKLEKDFNIATVDDYRSSDWKAIYAKTESGVRDKYLNKRTQLLITTLSIEVLRPAEPEPKPANEESEPFYRSWRHNYYSHYALGSFANTTKQKEIRMESFGIIVAKSKNVFFCPPPVRKDGVKSVPAKKMLEQRTILRTEYPDAEVITTDSGEGIALFTSEKALRTDTEQEIGKIKKKLGKDWREKCGLARIAAQKKMETKWPVHQWTKYGVQSTRVQPDRLGNNTLRVSGRIDPLIRALKLAKTKYSVTKDSPALRGGTQLSDFVQAMEDHEIQTREGFIKFRNLPKTGKIGVYVTENPEILQYYRPEDVQTMVAIERGKVFEIVSYLTAKNVQLEIITMPLEAEYKAKTGREKPPSDPTTSTLAYIGASTIKTPELLALFLNAAEAEYSESKVDEYLKIARQLDSEMASRTSPAQPTKTKKS